MSNRRTQTLALVVIAALNFGCAMSKPETSKSEMAWVRTDGRRIVDDPALLQQGKTDIALCRANLDAGAMDEGARECMTQKGYALVPKDKAEEARARYAAAAAQRGAIPPAAGR